MRPDRAVHHLGMFAKGILSTLVPPVCIACGRRVTADQAWLCAACKIALAVEARPMCRVVDLDSGARLAIRYCFQYTSRVSRIIAEMKYGDKPALAKLLVPFIAFALGGRVGPGVRVIPVPLHPSKRRERGYNQSRLLGKALAESEGLGFQDLLVKTRITVSQTTLEKKRRISNVVGSFGVNDSGPFPLSGALLVDDVVTTGSTLRECAQALRAAGIKEISACAVAASS
jgi:ComF family protein